MNNTNISRLLIIGSLPSPIGGVSIHLYRLLKELDDSEINYIFYDYKKDSFLNGLKKIITARFIHTHFSNKYLRFFSSLFFKILSKKTILTFHGKYNFQNTYDKLSLKLSTYNFMLNRYSYDNAVKIIKSNRIELISAFIYPREEENYLSSSLKKKIDSFIENKDIVVCTNAHSYVIDENGNDLYGIDFLLKIFSGLSDKKLIISDPSSKLKEHYSFYLKFENILFLSENHSFINVLKISDAFVRATTTDGDSLSIKEALYLNKKVIASDCVDRPDGCLIYRMGDEKSFIGCLDTDNKRNLLKIENSAVNLIKFYNNLLTNYASK